MTPQQFLREHWQKKPLLVRQAIAGFTGIEGLSTPKHLAAIAALPNAVARTVEHTPHASLKKKQWRLKEGPFAKLDPARVPAARWTLLVQGIEQHVDAAWDLLRRFDFIPTSRVDDLMVSWATKDGSVGPHFDAYDVFLLQGAGRRRWQITGPLDSEEKRACIEGEDVRILQQAHVVQEWILDPGDMLYLPPNIGHHGVALDNGCMTFSVGFLAPSHEQLVHNFLAFLGQEAGSPDGIYADPDLALQREPAELVDASVARVERVLDTLKWDRARVAEFMGRLLTGPKPSVQFSAAKNLDPRALDKTGTLKLAGATRMLFRGDRFFVNGEVVTLTSDGARALFRELANTRSLALPLPGDDDDDARSILLEMLSAGFAKLWP